MSNEEMSNENNSFFKIPEMKNLMHRKMQAFKNKAAAATGAAATGAAATVTSQAAAGAGSAAAPNLKTLFNNARKNKSSLLGKGGFGTVRRTLKNGHPVALKRVIFNESVTGENNIKPFNQSHFNKEVNALRSMKSNPYVLQYINSAKTATNAYLMTELLHTGMPLDIFAENISEISSSRLQKIIRNLLLGLKSIHDADYLHLDIKPSNIWVFPDDGMVKYIDFGLSCKQPCRLSNIVGTRGYIKTQPRGVNNKYAYDKTNDFYALSKTLEYLLEYADREQKPIIRPVMEELLTLTHGDNATAALNTTKGGGRRTTYRRRR